MAEGLAIAHMLAVPQPHWYGLLTNGRGFLCVKLQQQSQPTYAISPTFSINKSTDELAIVL